MLQMSAAEFKTHCLKLMDLAYEKGETVVITKRGIPYAQLMPYKEKKHSLYGFMEGTGEVVGDIISPIDVEWDAQK